MAVSHPDLGASLETIRSWHDYNTRPVTSFLQPGLTEESLSEWSHRFRLVFPEDLRQLYMWRNGTRRDSAPTLAEIELLPGLYFLSMEEAFEQRLHLKKLPRWSETWIPIFANGGGEFYAATAPADQNPGAEVICFSASMDHSEPLFDSITTLIQSAAECFLEGAYYVEDEGLAVRKDLEMRICHERNPRIPIWSQNVG